jgi:SAM-dependent methyltransferase
MVSTYTTRLAEQYSPGYYEWQQAAAARSAGAIVPLLQERLDPASVIDVGCGPGAWPAAWHEAGVDDSWGIDGSHVLRTGLLFSPDRFIAHDLRLPLALERRFDLVLSLEAAQHLPPESVDGFLDGLVRLGSTILFSAAVPHQGGDNHINERWQSWWVARFAERGFTPLDVIRPVVWNDGRVDWWYAQNALLYVEGDAEPTDGDPPPLPFDVVHPRNYLTQREPRHRPRGARVRRLIGRATRRASSRAAAS